MLNFTPFPPQLNQNHLSIIMHFLHFMLVAALGPAPAFGDITSSLQSILRNTHGSKDYGYPTDLTRDLLPVTIIGEMSLFIPVGEIVIALRQFPNAEFPGLSHGCTSTEADVWLYNGTLYVGHDQSALTASRTLESLYINPILDVLERQNPESPFLSKPTKNGVWDTDTEQTLYFFIDVKTSGVETFKAVIAALQPLREKGYLTTVKDGTITNGPVTIIGTGETPLDLVAPVQERDYFFDAPLAELTDARYANITGLVSPVASTDFQKAVGKITRDTDPILGDDQLKALREQIAIANERGIGARYWNTPYFPIRVRNLVWRTLLREGVILLNADDLDAVTEFF
ncbi:unnamed protein product [Penicillium salamii]|nr:unnamed protein product [Penicillium salamii]